MDYIWKTDGQIVKAGDAGSQPSDRAIWQTWQENGVNITGGSQPSDRARSTDEVVVSTDLVSDVEHWLLRHPSGGRHHVVYLARELREPAWYRVISVEVPDGQPGTVGITEYFQEHDQAWRRANELAGQWAMQPGWQRVRQGIIRATPALLEQLGVIARQPAVINPFADFRQAVTTVMGLLQDPRPGVDAVDGLARVRQQLQELVACVEESRVWLEALEQVFRSRLQDDGGAA